MVPSLSSTQGTEGQASEQDHTYSASQPGRPCGDEGLLAHSHTGLGRKMGQQASGVGVPHWDSQRNQEREPGALAGLPEALGVEAWLRGGRGQRGLWAGAGPR